jgi:hypothetical protein
MKPNNGEAKFAITSLYATPVEILMGNQSIDLAAKDLPKSGVVIDLAKTPSR